MKKWTVETLSLTGIVMVLALLGALAALAWNQMTLAGVASVRVDLNYERLAWLTQVENDVRLAQSEQRHYESAPSVATLAQRDAVLAALEQELAHGEQPGVSCNNALPTVRRLHQLVLGQLPPQRPAGAAPDTTAAALAQAAQLAASVIDIQRLHLAQVKLDDSRRSRQMRTSLAVLLLMLAGVTCAILFKIRSLTQARQRSAEALRAAHDGLEIGIVQRTAELQDAVHQLRAEVEVRQNAERALARSEAYLNEIVSMMPVALFIKDAQSRVIMMNQACEAMWGVRFAALATHPASHQPRPEQMAAFLAHDREAFAARALVEHEDVIWDARLGEDRYLQTFKKPVYDADGQPQMLIAMSIDVSERKRAELALQRSLSQLRALSDHQHNIKEEERRRIALDIHDELGQNLMALKIDASMLHARTGASHPRLHRLAARGLDTLDATIRSVRAIINELHPSTLELGLCAAIEWLLTQTERRNGLRCQLQLIDDGADRLLDARQTAGIFRIVQEALNHIEHYAAASTVRLSLDLQPQRLSIVIDDDGRARPDTEHSRAAAFAMKGIKERVAAYGGELLIARRHGSGTTLSILLPGVAVVPQPAAELLYAAGHDAK